MLKEVAKTKTSEGYCEILYKTEKRYYRIIRTAKGNWFDVFVNDSEYGEMRYDEDMIFDRRKVRESTIGDCKASIDIYDKLY